MNLRDFYISIGRFSKEYLANLNLKFNPVANIYRITLRTEDIGFLGMSILLVNEPWKASLKVYVKKGV